MYILFVQNNSRKSCLTINKNSNENGSELKI